MKGMTLIKAAWLCVGFVLILTLVLFLEQNHSQPKVAPATFLKSRTATLVKTVVFAIRDFQSQYGDVPELGRTPNTLEQQNNMLVQVLCADTNQLAVNPRGISFLPDSFKNNPDLLDAWGRPLHVVFAPRGSGSVRVGDNVIPGRVAVWSNGANGRNEYGEGDDIAGWK
jgi:hypothetical protein